MMVSAIAPSRNHLPAALVNDNSSWVVARVRSRTTERLKLSNEVDYNELEYSRLIIIKNSP